MVALFAVAFRIGELGDDVGRRASLIQQAHRRAAGPVWEETTSFLLLEARATAAELAQALYLDSAMNGDWDRLLVVDLGSKAYATAGHVEFPVTLAQLMAKR